MFLIKKGFSLHFFPLSQKTVYLAIKKTLHYWHNTFEKNQNNKEENVYGI